jgi:hypothetical protein
VRPNLAALALLAPLCLSACATASTPSTSSALPAREKTITDQVLAFDSAKEVGGDPGCGNRKIASTEVTIPFEPGNQGAAGQWSERWTVDRCGRLVPYLVHYMRAPDGHVGVNIMRMEGSDRAVMPGSTITDRVLQRDTFLLLVQKDLSATEGGSCRTRKVTDTEVLVPLDGGQVADGRPVAGQWTERWTLDRCGAPVRYIVHFVTTRTGTTFTTELER